MAIEERTEDNRFPNQRHYEAGFVFNIGIDSYRRRSKEQIEQGLINAGTEQEHIGPHMALIEEGLEFHGAEMGDLLDEELPGDFPARDKIEAAGLKTIGDVRQAPDEKLLGFGGVGPATVEKIRELAPAVAVPEEPDEED
jgi:hypothetical protein